MGNTNQGAALGKSRLRGLVDQYGLPRLIITGFLLFLFILADRKSVV